MNRLTFTYFFLNLICSLVFLFYGKILAQAKDDASYYKRALIPILTYAFVHGMRYDRLCDWHFYLDIYNNLGANVTWRDYEPLFAHICHILYNLGVPYFMFITLQCAFLMFCVIVLMKNYKEYLPYILPVVYSVIAINDQYIRWYTGYSFMLLAFNAMMGDKKILMWIFYLCSVGCHIGFILFAPLFVFYKLLDKRILPPVVNTIMLLSAYSILSITSVSSIVVAVTDFLLDIGVGEINKKMGYYLSVAQELTQGTWGSNGIMELKWFTLLRMAVAYFPAVFFAHKYVDRIKYGRLIYNLFAFGAITTPIFRVEILDRYSKSTVFFSCIVCAIVFKEFYDRRKELSQSFFLFLVICYFFAVWPTISQPVNYVEGAGCGGGNKQMFIWDAK